MTQEAGSGGAAVADVSATEVAAWRHRHLLDLDELTREEILTLLAMAEAMREVLARPVKRVPTLRGTTVATLFYEASTRTRASFELAAKVLGADVINLSPSGSSVEKGESLIDTVRTLQAIGVDVLVMRHWQSGAPYLAAQHADPSLRSGQAMAVVNGGDGWHAHPTQALLDIYTMRAHLGDLWERKVVIVGDIVHSRVARSNVWGLTAMGAQVVLCGPPTLLPADLGDGPLFGPAQTLRQAQGERRRLPPVAVETNLDRAIEGADVVMALRLQKERHVGADGRPPLLPSLREYVRLYQVNEERLARAKPDVLVMHPGPMNEGVEIAPGVAHGARSLIEEQVQNGVAVRMAVLYLVAGER
ncbi:MAG: aspartate carbamoyltransferase catalytic subunit [Dehalococcoidia bacterium]